MAASNTITYMMAAEAAAEIVSQKLVMLLSHPVCVRCSSMEPLAKEAKEKLAKIQEFFSTQDSLSLSTVSWLGELLQAMYDAEQFIDKFHLREARERHEALHMATRMPAALISKRKLWRDLSNLVNKMQDLCQNRCLTGKTRKGPACSSSPASVPGQGEKLARLTSLWNRQASVNFLRQKEKQKVMERIREGVRSRKLGWTLIWGEQGAGKTFLTRRVCREAMYLGFKWRAWVRLSTRMDMQEFLIEILKQMGELTREVKDMSPPETSEMLYKGLAKRKKFLIVLDDVHPSNVQILLRLLCIIPSNERGHIIITTQDIMSRTGFCQAYNGIELKTLNAEDSQEMLARKLDRVPDGQSLSKEKGILQLCQGLPLRISLLSGLLPNAGKQERAALAEDGSKMALLDRVQLSYHKLPIHLKPCFIYMALFPLASPIPTRRLVRLWLAEGLLDSHCYNEERKPTRLPEDVGETFILELVERNMIDVVSWRADGSPKACHMLTSLYNLIRPIVMDARFLHIHAASKSNNENSPDPTGQQQQLLAQQLERTKVRWLAEHTNIVTDSRSGSFPNLYLGHIRSFLSFCTERPILTKDTSTFLKNMTSKTAYSLLRVLDLEGVYKPSLQGVLHKLVLLRYLGLRSTVLDLLPGAVADLHYLETLDIKHTNITFLPSSFWKARELRHLHLNWFYINLKTILKARSNNGMALTKLQTLSGLVIGEVKENSMTVQMDSLTTLKLFLRQLDRDTSGTAGKAVADWISSRLTNLQSLTLGVTKIAKPATSQRGLLPKLSLAEHHRLFVLYLLGQLNKPIWTRLLPVSLRVLTLSGSRVEEDMMPQLGALLKQLRTLRLLVNSFLGTHLSFLKDGFPSLMILKIWKLPRLENVLIERGAMLHLKELEFRHLDAMRTVEGIDACEELETIIHVVKEGAQDFYDYLSKQKRTTTNLYQIEEFTELYDSLDQDEDEDKWGELGKYRFV